MNPQKKRLYSYRAFGFNFTSEIALYGFPESEGGVPDFTITLRPWKDLPSSYLISEETAIQAKTGFFLMRVQGLGIFTVEKGERITIYLEASVPEVECLGHLLSTVFVALSYQRKRLVLHGAVLCKNDKLTVICGKSGAGKSTLAAALCQHGYALYGDDLAVIDFDEEGRPISEPGFPMQKLSEKSLQLLGRDQETHHEFKGEKSKALCPISFHLSTKPLVVNSIYILRAQAREDIFLEQVDSIAKLHLLQNHSFRMRSLNSLWDMKNFYNKLTNLVESVEMQVLNRPGNPPPLSDLLDIVR